MKHTLGVIGITLLLGSVFSLNSFAQTDAAHPAISYDKKTDELTLAAKDASYKETMAQVAALTGIEILMDPKAEHNLTITLSKTPLEKALKDLGRNSSVAFVYSDIKTENTKDKTATTRTIITSMQILPKGEAGIGNLQPLLAPAGEAFIHEKNRQFTPKKELQAFNFAQQRWDARLKKMPPEQREKLQADATKKVNDIEKRKEKQEQRKEERTKIRQTREQERLADQERMKAENPELYEFKLKQREEARQARAANQPK